MAAKLTKTKKVGYVGGADWPNQQSNDGFKAGVQSVDRTIGFVTTTTGDFDDVTKAKEAAKAQITQSADVLFAFVNGGLAGVEQAIQESGKNVAVFGIIFPHCTESPHVAGSAILDSNAFVDQMIGDYVNKSLPAKPKVYGVDTPAIQRLEVCPRVQHRRRGLSGHDRFDGCYQQQRHLAGGCLRHTESVASDSSASGSPNKNPARPSTRGRRRRDGASSQNVRDH